MGPEMFDDLDKALWILGLLFAAFCVGVGLLFGWAIWG